MPIDKPVSWHLEYHKCEEEVFMFSQVSDMGEISVKQSGLHCSAVLISA